MCVLERERKKERNGKQYFFRRLILSNTSRGTKLIWQCPHNVIELTCCVDCRIEVFDDMDVNTLVWCVLWKEENYHSTINVFMDDIGYVTRGIETGKRKQIHNV